MKLRIAFLAVAGSLFLASCGSHCNADEWRKRRFVDLQQQNPEVQTSISG